MSSVFWHLFTFRVAVNKSAQSASPAFGFFVTAFNAKTNTFPSMVIKNDTIAQHLLPSYSRTLRALEEPSYIIPLMLSNTFVGGRSSIARFTQSWCMSHTYCKMLSTPKTPLKDCNSNWMSQFWRISQIYPTKAFCDLTVGTLTFS